jgi:hypothetical protein
MITNAPAMQFAVEGFNAKNDPEDISDLIILKKLPFF